MPSTDMNRNSWIAQRRLGIAVLAGGLMALAFPPFPFGFLAYICPALVLLAVRGLPPRSAAHAGFWFGTVLNVATLYWIGWVSVWGMLVIACVLGLYVALVFGCLSFLQGRLGSRAIWLFPVLWTAHEYLRGVGDLAFPWTNFSLTQVRYLSLIQFADATGDLGVTFWVCVIVVLVYRLLEVWTSPRGRGAGIYAFPLALLFILPFVYGFQVMEHLRDDAHVRVAVLQGDIDSYRKWDTEFVEQSFAVYEAQSRQAVADGAELVVWPETAAPVYLRSEPHLKRQLVRMARELNTHMLVGTLEYEALPDGGFLSFNAAVALDSGGYEPEYHAKLHLVPLGEWIPFSSHVKILEKLEVGGAHFTEGKKLVLFDHPEGPYAAAICFESVFPDIVRRLANRGARFLVNITNDGWYGFTSGPTQHAYIAVFRAIETRRPIARAANTGISLFVDRTGKVHDLTDQYVPDIAVFDLGLGPPGQLTFFMRYGMYVGKMCTLATAIILLLALFIRRRSRGGVEMPRVEVTR